MQSVSEYFICIPLRFPCRPWLYRKLSQWLINCPGPINEGARSQGQSGCSQCLLRDGERFSRENSRASDAVTQSDALIHGSSQRSIRNAVMVSIMTRERLTCFSCIYCNRGDGLSAPCLCYSHPSTDRLQDGDKRSQTTFVDVEFFPLSPAHCCGDMTS